MPIIDPDREPDLTPYQRAESYLYMMWMDVYHKCIAMIEQKIIDGSLGGGGGLTISEEDGDPIIDPADTLMLPNDTLVQDGVDPSIAHYKPKGATYWEMTGSPLSGASIPLGPVNVWNDAVIYSVAFSADVDCTITVTPGTSHTFGAGGGLYTATGLSVDWILGVEISVSVTGLGTGGTYVNTTIGFRFK